jgi:hypothetical protein
LADGISVRAVARGVGDLSRRAIKWHLHHHATLEELNAIREAS